ncbi:hypothetical protein ACIO3O_15950 [Streptomyces sp. NPDC087440]|uniref:hypothetical protein n=1 Tax=Streptomyces sp. NPDC087440 TaxID=3365790 RepID=UPI0037FF7760
MGTGTDDGASVSDEEWEKFLRDSVNGVPGAPKEPSARARMVTRRLQEEPQQAVPWRAHVPVRRRRFRVWHVFVLVAAVALLAVAFVPGSLAGWFGGGASPGVGSGERGTVEEPFRGSPADRWEDGARGIFVPQAKATGWMSAAQVEQALAKTRDFLVAANLDADTLRGKRPDKAITLVNPQQADTARYLRQAFLKPDAENDPLLLFSRFDGGKVRLVGDVVKVRGELSFRAGARGAVEVASDVTYVYPVTRAAADSREVVRTVVRREVVASWDDPAKVRTDPGTFSLLSYKVNMTNGGCGVNLTGFFAPEFGTRAGGEGPDTDPYDRKGPVTEGGADGSCGNAVRS